MAPSQPSFVGLPIEIRNNIYKRLLILPHPLYLFQDPGSQVAAFSPETSNQWLALLYVNRQIFNEAKVVLYGMNRFTLMEMQKTQGQMSLLESFLNCIGYLNAGLLSHISINFPTTERLEDQPEEIRPREDSFQDLQLLQKECTKLRTLETVIASRGSYIDLIQADQHNIQYVREALLEINAQFKDMASLNKIVVRIYSGCLVSSLKEFMQELGWVVLHGDRN